MLVDNELKWPITEQKVLKWSHKWLSMNLGGQNVTEPGHRCMAKNLICSDTFYIPHFSSRGEESYAIAISVAMQ
jgi:hypothetical protein